MGYKDDLAEMYQTMTRHLVEIQELFHRQQIQHFRSIIFLRLTEVEDCKIHHQQLTELHDSLGNGGSTNLHRLFTDIQSFAQDAITDSCRQILLSLQDEMLTYIQLVSRQNTPMAVRFTSFEHLDSSEVYDQVIDPLSNQKRLEIMLAIQHGRKRFKDLEADLELQAGHLIYHLNPLKRAEYVIQDKQKNYILSDKGLAILSAITRILEDYRGQLERVNTD